MNHALVGITWVARLVVEPFVTDPYKMVRVDRLDVRGYFRSPVGDHSVGAGATRRAVKYTCTQICISQRRCCHVPGTARAPRLIRQFPSQDCLFVNIAADEGGDVLFECSLSDI